MAVRREPTLANHSAHRASFAHCKIDGNMIRVLTCIGGQTLCLHSPQPTPSPCSTAVITRRC